MAEPANATPGDLPSIAPEIAQQLLTPGGEAAEKRVAVQMLELMPVAVFVCDRSGRITAANRRAIALWGRAPRLHDDSERFCGAHRLRVAGTIMAPEASPIARALRSTQTVRGFEAQIERPDGTRCDVAYQVELLRDTAGATCGAIAVVEDITRRKQEERNWHVLTALTEALATLVDETAIIRTTTAMVGGHLGVDRCTFVEANEERGEIITRDAWRREGLPNLAGTYRAAEFFRPEIWRAIMAGRLAVEDVATEPATKDFAAAYAKLGVRSFAAGACHRAKPRAFVLVVFAGTPRSWRPEELELIEQAAGRAWPLIERARASEALRQGEQRLRMATRAGRVGLWDWDIEGDRMTWTETLFEIHGLPPGGVAPMPDAFANLIHPEDRQPVRRAMRSALDHNAPYELEFRAVRPDGGTVWLFTTATVIRDHHGRPQRMLGATIDITARKTAELALRESEQRFRALINQAPVGIVVADAHGDTVFINDSWRTLSGLTLEMSRGRGWINALHPEDRERVVADWYAAVGEGRRYHGEYRFKRPDGGVTWLQSGSVELRDARGTITGFVRTVVDITQRKAAEDLLRSSERRFRTLTTHAPVGIFLTDPAGETLFVNESWCQMTGLTPAQARGNGWIAAIHPADRERVIGEWHTAVEHDASAASEYRFVHADGEITWVQGNAVQLRDDAGHATGYIGTIVDVTPRKLAENTLRAHEMQLRLITMNAPVSLARVSRDDTILFVNRANAERFRLSVEEVVGRKLVELLGAEALAAMRPYMQRALAGESFTCEVDVNYERIGSRFIRVSYAPEFAADGTVCGWISATTDITERRQMENALRESEARFREMANTTPVLIWMTNAAGCEFVNRACVDFFGVPETTLLGAGAMELLHPDDHEILAGAYVAAAGGLKSFAVESRARRHDGDWRWMLTRGLPRLAADGTLLGYIGSSTDVTDLKRATEALQQRTRDLEVLNRVANALVAELAPEKIVASVVAAGRAITGATAGLFVRRPKADLADAAACSAEMRAAGDANAPIELVTKLWPLAAGVFRGGGALRIHDLNAYGRAGADIPARSFLALPMMSRTGEVLGALFFGHTEPGRFPAEVEQTLVALAAQAAIALDNAELYQVLGRELEQKRRAEADLVAAQEQLRAHAAGLESTVQQRTASLREAIEQMEEFSYSVSHDLRAPLRAMNAYAQALVDDYGAQLDEAARGYLQRIQRNSQRMEKLTHDVLIYSRVARAEAPLGPVDVGALLREVINQYAELQPPAVEIVVDAPLLTVLGHELSLGQSLANLMTNAAKFVPPGVRPRIVVRTVRAGARVRIWIEDNGIGIDPRHQQRLFRVFERVPTPQPYEGTGIGLAIVRKAVEKMGGTCGVESDGEHGSRFWIELPEAR